MEMQDLAATLTLKIATLRSMARTASYAESQRLNHKADGVRLALSFVNERIRENV